MFWKYFPLHEEEARTSLKIALVFVALWLYTKDAITGHLTETAALLTSIRDYLTHCIMFLSIYILLELIIIFITRLVLAFWPGIQSSFYESVVREIFSVGYESTKVRFWKSERTAPKE